MEIISELLLEVELIVMIANQEKVRDKMRINEDGYVERRTNSGKKTKNYRDWWLIKCNYDGSGGTLNRGKIYVPERYVGKKIRLKVEVIEE